MWNILLIINNNATCMKNRGKTHTSLTETAQLVVNELEKLSGIDMIAPGVIESTRGNRTGKRHLTFVRTRPGCELIISGQSVQKVAIHTKDPAHILEVLGTNKKLREFTIKTRVKIPGE